MIIDGPLACLESPLPPFTRYLRDEEKVSVCLTIDVCFLTWVCFSAWVDE